MKRILSIFIILTLILGVFVGCSNDNTDSVSNSKVEESSKEVSKEVSEETKDAVEDKTDKVELEENQEDEENKEESDNATPESMKDEMETALTEALKPLPESGKNEKIGILVITLNNPFWSNMKEKYELAANELGVELEVFATDQEGDAQKQLEVLESMLAKDYEAIIVSPIDPNNLIPGIVKANEQGIKIINLGPGVNIESLEEQGGYLDGRITVDFENQGKMIAEEIIEKIDGTGKVSIIQGIPGAGQSEGRTNGAKEKFESTEGINLISIQAADWDRNKAYETTKALIQANEDLKAIFAVNDVMALGAVEALEDEGIKDDVIVYGVDFTDEAKTSIEEGKLNGSITYSPKAYTKAAVILAQKIIQGHDIKESIYSPLLVVNQENIELFSDWE